MKSEVSLEIQELWQLIHNWSLWIPVCPQTWKKKNSRQQQPKHPVTMHHTKCSPLPGWPLSSVQWVVS